MSSDGLGFRIVQLLLEARTVQDLDDAMSIVNRSYGVIRDHVEVLEQIEIWKNDRDDMIEVL